MGGTSTDVALCDGTVPLRSDVVVAGFPASTTAVDVHTVGAGGGSIARLDAGDALRVGPRSAGAEPGPAAYGRGTEFTVTDAQVVLGRLGPEGLLAGAMPLDERRARRASSGLVHAFGGDPHAAAAAVVDVTTANLERAARVVSVQRGYDPRDFTLVAFGGAGPLHACGLAEALGIPRVLVPPQPGVLAALGAATSDLTATSTRSVLAPLQPSSRDRIEAALASAAIEAREQVGTNDATVSFSLDIRYVGQSYELSVPATRSIEMPAIREAFDAMHEARFAHHDPDAAVEVVNARASARTSGSSLHLGPAAPRPEAVSPRSTRDVWFQGQRLPTPILPRTGLAPGARLRGPAIVTQLDSTTLVEPGWAAEVDRHGNILMVQR
jgi:N-methylhydantoinase A